MTKKLYKVTLRGMTHSYSGTKWGESYVVANDSEQAYKKVREYLDKMDIGFRKDRELLKVELLADCFEYNDIGTVLYL